MLAKFRVLSCCSVARCSQVRTVADWKKYEHWKMGKHRSGELRGTPKPEGLSLRPNDLSDELQKLAKRLRSCKSSGQAVSILNSSKKSNIAPHNYTYNIAMQRAANEFKFDLVKRLFEELKSDPNYAIDVGCYTTMIHACSRTQGDPLELAMPYFLDMKEKEILPNVFTYTAMIAASSKNRNNHFFALKLLEEMKNKSLVPDVFTYCALLRSANSGGYGEAQRIYQQMLDDRIEPNFAVHSTMAWICGNHGRPHEAIEHFKKDMQSRKPNIASYELVISACAKNGLQQEAIAFLDQMKQNKIQPDVMVYNRIMQVCMGNGDVAKIYSLYEDMAQFKVKPDDTTKSFLK